MNAASWLCVLQGADDAAAAVENLAVQDPKPKKEKAPKEKKEKAPKPEAGDGERRLCPLWVFTAVNVNRRRFTLLRLSQPPPCLCLQARRRRRSLGYAAARRMPSVTGTLSW